MATRFWTKEYVFLNSAGNPRAGGKLYAYETGTTTPLDTFYDDDLAPGHENSNPITLNASGRLAVDVFGSSDQYKFVITNSDGTDSITLDPMYTDGSAVRADLADATDAAKGDDLVAYKRALTGSTARTLHDWHEDQAVNVKDFGATGDGTADDSDAFEAALAAVTSGGTIYIPPGTFRINITVDKAAVWQGAGMTATVVRAYSGSGIVFKNIVNANSWTLQSVFNDMTISSTGGLRVGTGIQLGDATPATDNLSGRVECNRVRFTNLQYCVRKMFGNLGNTFNRCLFGDAEFHMHAVSSDGVGVEMHCGNDVFGDMCRFGDATKACFYYDNAQLGGQVIVDNCIFEANPGFIWFVKDFNNIAWAPGISMSRCWNENNATSASVEIDSVTYTPPVFARFVGADLVSISETRLTTIELESSVLIAKACHYDSDFALTADADSAMINHDIHVDDIPGGLADEALIQSVSNMARTSGGFVRGISIPHPKKVGLASGGTVLASLPFVAVTAFTGTASLNTTPATDGVNFDVSQELSYTSAQTESAGGASITSGKFYCAMVTVMKVSGNSVELECRNGVTLGTLAVVDNADWKTFAFISKSVSSGTVALKCNPPASGTTVLRFGGYALVEFDTLQEAISFINAGVFPILTTALLRTAFTVKAGTGSVLSGATTAVITHGLGLTPTAADIAVVFTEQGTSDYGRWWIDTITSTQFTVNVSANPGASNLDFSWKAIV